MSEVNERIQQLTERIVEQDEKRKQEHNKMQGLIDLLKQQANDRARQDTFNDAEFRRVETERDELLAENAELKEVLVSLVRHARERARWEQKNRYLTDRGRAATDHIFVSVSRAFKLLELVEIPFADDTSAEEI